MYDLIGRIAFVGLPAVAVFYVLVVAGVWWSEGLEGVPRAILGGALGAAAWVGGSLWWVLS